MLANELYADIPYLDLRRIPRTYTAYDILTDYTESAGIVNTSEGIRYQYTYIYVGPLIRSSIYLLPMLRLVYMKLKKSPDYGKLKG